MGVRPSADWCVVQGDRVEVRRQVKLGLARAQGMGPAQGATLLIYHRVGGGTADELDVTRDDFVRHVELMSQVDVAPLDTALDRLEAGDASPTFVLTFDDGFSEVYDHAWPVLREAGMPFTIYLASAYVGAPLRWEGSTARGVPGRGLTWPQLEEMVSSGLCTIGNHTHSHVRPNRLSENELDRCTELVLDRLGIAPRHFTYTWGIPVARMEAALRERFRSASTGELGRNRPGADFMRLRRVPVRRSDPVPFVAAKLVGDLLPERAYGRLVGFAKRAGMRG